MVLLVLLALVCVIGANKNKSGESGGRGCTKKSNEEFREKQDSTSHCQ